NIKVINNIAGLGTAFSSKNFLNLVAINLYKYSQKKADFIFFQNKEDAIIFKSFGINESNTDILPGSGVDLRRFNVCPVHTDNVVRFALVARMLVDKGVMQYIECAENLKSKYGNRVEFLLVGFLDDNNPRAVHSSIIEKWTNKDIVKYLGVSDSIEDIVSNVDCVVLPSFYREGVPKSLLEAAAMGRPLITTDSIGCKETVINNVTGYLCEPRSVSDLCAKMEKIISMSKEDKVKMGLAGRQYIERNFDERIVVDKYLNVISDFFE
ncbi:TPA: glycosyltransferase family 4 protein, partial [Escherichia coli]|nr:glycosyltransferase family 4 protein [Escherichia coli]